MNDVQHWFDPDLVELELSKKDATSNRLRNIIQSVKDAVNDEPTYRQNNYPQLMTALMQQNAFAQAQMAQSAGYRPFGNGLSEALFGGRIF